VILYNKINNGVKAGIINHDKPTWAVTQAHANYFIDFYNNNTLCKGAF
jgi:hypothetical protein